MAMILVVDDDRLVRVTLENCLRNAGHAVVVAQHGQEAIRYLNERTFDAVILDMNMPEVDGWTTAVYIRKSLSVDVPIIAYSAYKLEGDKARALGAGCTHFLPKPVDVGQFMETLSLSLDPTMKTCHASLPPSEDSKTKTLPST